MSTKQLKKKKKKIIKAYYGEISEFQDIRNITEENVTNKGLVIKMALKQQ